MPNREGDDETNDAPDWTARAKALEFLSDTLEYVGKDILKASQGKKESILHTSGKWTDLLLCSQASRCLLWRHVRR